MVAANWRWLTCKVVHDTVIRNYIIIMIILYNYTNYSVTRTAGTRRTVRAAIGVPPRPPPPSRCAFLIRHFVTSMPRCGAAILRAAGVPFDVRSLLTPHYDVYEGFDRKKWDRDRQLLGFGTMSKLTRQAYRQVYQEAVANATALATPRPPLLVEVGVWKGESAITLAREVQRQSAIGGTVLAVDTFAGAAEMWMAPMQKAYMKSARGFAERDLRLMHGMPTIYFQFLANVIRENVSRTIVPFPVDALTASAWLRKLCLQADLVHIDAGHEYESVRADIEAFWPVLRAGGILLGDDYSGSWPGVVTAARELAARENVHLHTTNPSPMVNVSSVPVGYYKWWVRKGSDAAARRPPVDPKPP